MPTVIQSTHLNRLPENIYRSSLSLRERPLTYRTKFDEIPPISRPLASMLMVNILTFAHRTSTLFRFTWLRFTQMTVLKLTMRENVWRPESLGSAESQIPLR